VLRREVERFESLDRLRVERAAHVGVDEIVFRDPQPPCDLVARDAQLVEALRLVVGQESQQVANEVAGVN
jgi:hypothetical protein